MAQDILMIAEPAAVTVPRASHPTQWLTADEWWRNETTAAQHDTVLWQAFHSHGKYQRIIQHATYIASATTKKGDYLGSAAVIEIGSKWLIEYVMTDPRKHGKGIGSSLLSQIMRRAKQHEVAWVILNCDPQANNGQLPKFYGRFGFQTVSLIPPT